MARTILGGDVSFYQASNQEQQPTTPMDFRKAEANGWIYSYIRSSHGLSKDPEYPRHYILANDTALLRGNYHYFEAWAKGVDQADFFLETTKTTRGELPPALDVEVKCSASEIWAFVQYIFDAWACYPLIYTSPNAWNNYVSDNIFKTNKNKFSVCELWQAQWPYPENDDGKTIVGLTVLQPWGKVGKQPVIHQYSTKAQLGSKYGSNGSINIDLDLADPEWLHQFSKVIVEPPKTWAQEIDAWARQLSYDPYDGPYPEA